MKKLILLFLSSFIFLTSNHAQSFNWVKTGTGADSYLGRNLMIDPSGNTYNIGGFYGTSDFNGIELTSNGGSDIYIQKLDKEGNTIWLKSIGGLGLDWASSIDFDTDGNIYVTGDFEETVDFDPSVEINELVAKSIDSYILKLDSDGNFIWVKTIGGDAVVQSYDIVIDLAGDVIIGGRFQGTIDFDPSAGEFELTPQSEVDAYLLKLNSEGDFIWVSRMGGTGEVLVESFDVDAANNIFSTGNFNGTVDFDPTDGVSLLIATEGPSAFILKLNPAGDFLWAKNMDSSVGFSLAVDLAGNVLSTGNFFGTVDFDPNAGVEELTAIDERDIFIQKLDAEGNLVWAKGIGGDMPDFGVAVAVDELNNVYFTGYFSATADFDPGEEVLELSAEGEIDIFIEKLDQDGNLVWVRKLEGEGACYGTGIAIGRMGEVQVKGIFWGQKDFDPGVGAFKLNAIGNENFFILKLNQEGSIATQNLALAATNLFPNPNNGHFEIALPQNASRAQVQIMDAFGKNVYQNHLNNATNLLDLEHLPAGLYFLNMTLETREVYHAKLLIQK